jgi:hypothetical protein
MKHVLFVTLGILLYELTIFCNAFFIPSFFFKMIAFTPGVLLYMVAWRILYK